MLFNLDRYAFKNHDIYEQEMLDYWQFYCKDSPYWKTRVCEFNGYYDGKELMFNNPDDNEKFHDLYGYELDEQKKHIQQCSLKPCGKNIDFDVFLKHIFKIERKKIINIPKKMKLIL